MLVPSTYILQCVIEDSYSGVAGDSVVLERDPVLLGVSWRFKGSRSLRSFETTGNTCPATWSQIAEKENPQIFHPRTEHLHRSSVFWSEILLAAGRTVLSASACFVSRDECIYVSYGIASVPLTYFSLIRTSVFWREWRKNIEKK